MKELYMDLLEKKYYFEEKRGHFFINGLGMQLMIDDRQLAEDTVNYLMERYGLEEITFNQRVKEYNKIRKISQELERKKLVNKYGSIRLLKILEEI